jgi:prolyl-tRNA editing enzyme YbaK/EbsC (Cys-tRNA(Pro) deacylase)
VRAWPEAVERVAAHVRAQAADARIEEFADGTPTAAEAAKAIGCDESQIVKSLLFATPQGYVLALVPGDRRADPRKVGSDARIAGPDEVRRVTGFEPGAVAPFPVPEGVRVIVDRSLLAHELVWTGAGSRNHMAALTPPDLLRLTDAGQADLVE